MKIKIIVPIITDAFNQSVSNEAMKFGTPGVEYVIENLRYGPASIECEYDEALAVPGILELVEKAQTEGFDGAMVDCFADPGVKAAREKVDIVVMGGFEPSMLLAAGLGDNLGIVTVLPNLLPVLENRAKTLGIAERLKSIRYVNIPVLDLSDSVKLENALYKQCMEAVEKDGVHVLVLGCTGMMGMADNLHERLKAAGYGVPVIDPFISGIKMIERYASMRLKHSRLTYMTPTEKERKWWG